MNKKCKGLGMVATSFTNPHGMTTSVNLSSAKDLLALSIHCYRNPLFMKIASAREYSAYLLQEPEDED